MISPEDQEAIDLELKDLREDHTFGSEDEYDCVKAMLSALALHSNNPDLVGQEYGDQPDQDPGVVQEPSGQQGHRGRGQRSEYGGLVCQLVR